MIQYEDECVGCGFPCIGEGCHYKNVPHFYCDECGTEDEIYEFEDEQLCIDCIRARLTPVTV